MSWGAQTPAEGAATPGVVLVFSGREPTTQVIPGGARGVQIGRGQPADGGVNDSLLSRQHARIEPTADGWKVSDLGSRNGTAVDGNPVRETVQLGPGLHVLRAGESLFLLLPDIRAFLASTTLSTEAFVLGPTMQQTWHEIAHAASTSATLHVHGESGAGKELAARAFHDLGPSSSGPFVAVNCATITEGLAERLLFGARRGAFSGAHADATGYLQAADGGTIFLDEIAELGLTVQAKLLRVLETREVLPVGASHPIKIKFRLVTATHRDLRAMVADRGFREDLFFRVGRPAIHLPALRERKEDLPYLIARELRRATVPVNVHASFVEACLLRPWPGNVRELQTEVQQAIGRAIARRTDLDATLLDPDVGHGIPTAPPGVAAAEPDEPEDLPEVPMPSTDEVLAALREHEGRIATTARALGIHRSRLRRWMLKHATDVAALGFGREGSA
ncbi:MAG: sigma 54-interacting transcriptional regulator [Deltaproteobacteria bacterium]|nr:sigma 54-interacting transcriptional regulator [Deltaproteobacteria bacterium]